MQETAADIEHRQAARERLSHNGKKFFKFIEFDANEQLVTEIRKHPFGLFLVLLVGGFVTLTILGVAVLTGLVDLNSAVGQGDPNALKGVIVLLCLLLAVGAVIGTAIAVFLYVNNVIFVTSEKIAQVLYISLFNRKISQLSIGDVQDVTVTQKGIFAHIFNYGTLVVETAGEQQNYTFTFVPDPYQNSKLIVGAHETNLKAYGN